MPGTWYQVPEHLFGKPEHLLGVFERLFVVGGHCSGSALVHILSDPGANFSAGHTYYSCLCSNPDARPQLGQTLKVVCPIFDNQTVSFLGPYGSWGPLGAWKIFLHGVATICICPPDKYHSEKNKFDLFAGCPNNARMAHAQCPASRLVGCSLISHSITASRWSRLKWHRADSFGCGDIARPARLSVRSGRLSSKPNPYRMLRLSLEAAWVTQDIDLRGRICKKGNAC